VLEHNDFRLKIASEDQIRKIHRQIQDSAYYSKEYTAETKCEYKKLVRVYFKWENGGFEVPKKAAYSPSETAMNSLSLGHKHSDR